MSLVDIFCGPGRGCWEEELDPDVIVLAACAREFPDDVIVLAAYAREFADDVMAVAHRGDVSIKQVARDFGIAESRLLKWLARYEVEAGVRPGVTRVESGELKTLKHRNRELELENGVVRRAAASAGNHSPTR